jgi:hypothetical protein
LSGRLNSLLPHIYYVVSSNNKTLPLAANSKSSPIIAT